MSNNLRILTSFDARRAIYIDFEGTAVDPPSFLGVFYIKDGKECFNQYVVEKNLWPACDYTQAIDFGFCLKSSWMDLSQIRIISETENRRIFAWSAHEAQELFNCIPDTTDKDWFAQNVENAIPYAKIWRRNVHPEIVFDRDPRLGRNHLSRYMRLINYEIPISFGPGNSAQRIRYVRKMLEKKDGDFNKLTAVAKGKWTKVLKHNWHDCKGLREIVITCAMHLEQESR